MADVGFGTVHGRYRSADLDTTDSAVAPDLVPLGGSVLFTATASVIRVVGATEAPETVLPKPVRVALDADGYLAVDGSRDVTLLATDSAESNPTDWQWHVSFDLTHDGVPVYHVPFNFELPEGAVVDLTVVAPLVEPSPGTIIIQGPPGTGGSSVPDATALVKGVLRLTGDLGGTALSPTVPALAAKADAAATTAALAGKADAAATTAALAGKAATAHTHAEADVTGLVADLAAKADAAATTAALAGKAATAHTHVAANVTDFSAAADARVAAGITGKADLASPIFTGNPTAPTPATADNDTSVATTAFVKAQGYAPLASPAFTGTPTGITKAHVGLGNVDNTADASKPVSTAQAAADAAVLASANATRGLYVGVNAQTGTTYTPVLADQGKIVTLSNAGAITVTMPSDSTVALPLGTQIDFAVIGVGMATFVAGAGATVNGTPSLVTRAQYSAVSLVKIAANTWLAIGDFA